MAAAAYAPSCGACTLISKFENLKFVLLPSYGFFEEALAMPGDATAPSF